MDARYGTKLNFYDINILIIFKNSVKYNLIYKKTAHEADFS